MSNINEPSYMAEYRERNRRNYLKLKERKASPDYVERVFSEDYLMKHPDFKMNHRATVIHNRFKSILKNDYYKRDSNIGKILGAPLQVVKAHIESQFDEGMSWDNFGGNIWQIRYVKKIHTAKTFEDLDKLFHYSNLKPVWFYKKQSSNRKTTVIEDKPQEIEECKKYRTNITILFKKVKASADNETAKLLGCGFDEAREHLKNQFSKGMGWHNYLERRDGSRAKRDWWLIDFITPLSTAKNEEELKKLFHYSNLKPTWYKK